MSGKKFSTLVDVFDLSVQRFSSRPLFGVKTGGTWNWMTYGEFGREVDRLRAGLAALGFGAGDRLALIANNRPEWAIAAYATYGRGGAIVPMYEQQLAKEWVYILKDCGAKVVIAANEKIRDEIAGHRAELPALEHLVVLDGKADAHSTTFADVLAKGDAAPTATEHPAPDDIAGFIYTSGTTGNPKGVLLSHRNFASNVSAIHEIFPIEPDDRTLAFLPWAHSFGQTVELHGILSLGGSLGLAEGRDKIVENLSEVRPTILVAVPQIFNRIYDGLHKRMAEAGGLKKALFDAAVENARKRARLEGEGSRSGWLDFKHGLFDKLVFSKVRERFGGRLKYAFSGGAALSKEVAYFIDALGIMVYEGYGLTETSPIATANYPGARKIGSIGRAIPGVTIEIDKSITGDPVDGEIIVRGPNVMKGYHNLPEENAKVFTADGGFRTGDMGRVDEDGFVFITGRIKEQYKLENGKYVVPSPLEEKLKLSPFVVNAMVYGADKPYNVALVVPDLEAVRKWAGQNGVDVSDAAALCADARVHKLIEGELEKYSSDFKSYERVKRFVLAAEDFTTENGMLTPSLKVKRRTVLGKYGSDIQALYGA